MSAEQRDFSTFYLPDNVYRLAGGVVLELAAAAGVRLGAEPDPGELGQLIGKIGPNKVLRENHLMEEVFPIAQAAALVEQSGVQKPLNRSLWRPDIQAAPKQGSEPNYPVMTGGVANWMDRSRDILFAVPRPKRPSEWTMQDFTSRVSSPVGNRIMSTATEKNHPAVAAFHAREGRYPTETEYMRSIHAELREEGYYKPELFACHTTNGDTIATLFAGYEWSIFAHRVTAVRVANAGVMLAAQLRKACRLVNPQFDTDSKHPQQFILTDTLEIATTEAQLKDPVHYQSPYTALRQVVVTAKAIAEAALMDER